MNEINDEIIERKEIDIYRKFKFLFFNFFHLAKICNAKGKLLLSNHKTFFIETYTLTLSNTRPIKFVNFKKGFAQFPGKIFKNQCFSEAAAGGVL